MKTKAISVFFPSFNEEGNIESTVNRAIKVLKELKLKYEIIIVNDGSTDQTAKVAEILTKKNPNIKVIDHEKNLGYGEALKSGFYNTRYDTIVYTDGDGQFDFAEVTKFLEKIEENDLIIGYRIKRQDPFFRRLFGKGWRLSLLTFFGLTLKDVDCGFKMIKREVLEKIPHLESQRGAMINAELAIKAKKWGFKVSQIGVNHYPRLSGRPTGASVRVIIKSYLDLLRLWWKLKDEKKYFITLLLVILLASFLRLYKIDAYMIFLGDQGRDALVVKRMLGEYHFPLIGPPTSVGNIYLGPFYYYMMLIPMALFNLNPVTPSIMIALIGVATVILVYFLGKSWFGRKAGLISAYLYAISPVNINYSNFSWNPNPMPFFALLSICALYLVHKTGNFLYLILTAASLAASLQMHYLGFILLPIAVVLFFYEIVFRKYSKRVLKNLTLGTVFGIFTFLMIMSPLFWFDVRHNFLNYKAFTKLLATPNTLGGNILINLSKIPQLFSYNLAGRYISGQNIYLQTIVSALLIIILIIGFYPKVWKNTAKWPLMVLTVWLMVGLLGISFYQQEVYDHYLGFLNPAPFLLLGSLTTIKIIPRSLLNLFLIILIIALSLVNFQKNPLLIPPNNQLKRTQEVAKFIIKEAYGEDFNFALLAKNNYDAAYQFYLEQYNHKPKQVPFDKTDQLFVVCEDEICDPTHSPKYEIAAYGMSKVDWLTEYYGVKIYKLVPNPSGKP